MKPRIALNCDIQGGEKARAFLNLDYLECLRRAGAVPVILPPFHDVDSILDDLDGVMFTGGDDYRMANGEGEPAQFVPVDPLREQGDLHLARSALDRDLPVLGICGGFQLIVLILGGELIGDLPSDANPRMGHRRASDSEPLAEHEIHWEGGDHPIPITAGTHRVNSHHHQGISSLPPEWRSLARSEDGLVEAACGPGTFRVGVQWHPERGFDQPVNRLFFEAFVDAARAEREVSPR